MQAFLPHAHVRDHAHDDGDVRDHDCDHVHIRSHTLRVRGDDVHDDVHDGVHAHGCGRGRSCMLRVRDGVHAHGYGRGRSCMLRVRDDDVRDSYTLSSVY